MAVTGSITNNPTSITTKRAKSAIHTTVIAKTLSGKNKANLEDLRAIAIPALQHRLRRNPLDDSSSAVRIERALAEVFPV